MPEFWFKHSNPSTLTAGGLSPNFILTQPRDDDADEEDEEEADGDGNAVAELGWRKGEFGETGLSFSTSRKRASWANGFAALLGGEPGKYGDEDTGDDDSNCPIGPLLLLSSWTKKKRKDLESKGKSFLRQNIKT